LSPQSCFAGGSPKVVLSQASGGSALCPDGSLTITSSDDGAVPLGLWTHVAVTLHSANLSSDAASNCPVYDDVIVAIYVNGQLLGNLTRTVMTAASTATASASATLTIGQNFVGAISDVAL